MIRMSEGTCSSLRALLATIKASPIVARARTRLSWASVRKSPEVDAYVLAWIASHVHGSRRRPRNFI
jgi:hypothetical protein